MNTNPHAKRILCYGDSYTWGYIPSSNHERYPANVRLTGVLQELLGANFEIIEEGLNSRTLISDDSRPGKEGRNGSTYIIPCLDTHDPIDLVILLLGTNELKDEYNSKENEIEDLVESHYVKVIINRKSQFSDKKPKLLLISPPKIDLTKDYALKRYSKSKELNNKIPAIYERIATKYNCLFLDTSKVVKVGSDGIHMDLLNHRKLAEMMAEIVNTHMF
ncbi:MAG TPA: GDSL-type esterase/lipase family protein [Candidatus Dojkabacteria bacterium]|nr:GDSL-type esterase/lipase family protein [Candidatus Dojkabacteria bacterium]